MFRIRLAPQALWASCAAVVALALCPCAADAQNRYSVLHIDNRTKDLTIYYQIRWGTNSEWSKKVSLAPGTRWNHWFAYTKDDENKAPVPQISFNSGIDVVGDAKLYNLEANPRPTSDKGGKVFAFVRKANAQKKDYVELQTAEDDVAVVNPNVRTPDQIASELYKEGLKSQEERYYTKAIEWFTQALKASPTFPEANVAHNNIGFIYLSQGKLDLAIAEFNQGIELNARNAGLFNNRAAAYFKKSSYNQAVKDCDQALRIVPKLASAYRWRSQAYGKLGETAKARSDYITALGLDPAQEELFEYTSFLIDRQEALRALESFKLGSTLTAKALEEVNNFPGGEPLGKSDGEMSGSVKVLLAAEKVHLRAVEHEMVAAANILLKAAKVTEAERAAQGLKLGWLFGPVTAPNARAESKDGLGGLRVIGRLELPDGREINAISAFKFHPAKDTSSDEEGKVGWLSDVDTFRLEVRLFKKDNTKTDYAFQSFRIAGEGNKLRMQPGFYLNPMTGALANKELVFTALGTNCINCHLSGPKFKPEQIEQMEKRDYKAMDGYKDFLEQMKHWSASKTLRKKMEAIMKEQGPAGFLPIDAMLQANREHWMTIYPRYLERKKGLYASPAEVLAKEAEAAPVKAQPSEIIREFIANDLERFFTNDLKKDFERKDNKNGSILYDIKATDYWAQFNEKNNFLMFYAVLQNPDVSMETLNSWNRDAVHSRVYRNGKNVILEVPLSTYGGITRDTVQDYYALLEVDCALQKVLQGGR